MAKELNFNFNFLDIDGNDYHDTIGYKQNGEEVKAPEPLKANIQLGKALFLSAEGNDDYMKCYEWAIELKKTGLLNLDTQDTEKLAVFIKNMKVANFVKAQLKLVFDKK